DFGDDEAVEAGAAVGEVDLGTLEDDLASASRATFDAPDAGDGVADLAVGTAGVHDDGPAQACRDAAKTLEAPEAAAGRFGDELGEVRAGHGGDAPGGVPLDGGHRGMGQGNHQLGDAVIVDQEGGAVPKDAA